MEDSKIIELFDKLGKDIDELTKQGAELTKQGAELTKQVGINCTKLDKMDNKLDQLSEIGKKNQNSINELIKLNRQNV